MKVVYYTSGTSGSGRIVMGIAIGNAFKRKKLEVNYTILSSSPFAFLAADYHHVELPLEEAHLLIREKYRQSLLYQQLTALQPDVLLVNLYWPPLYHILPDLHCKKVFIARQVSDQFFHIDTPEVTLDFNARDYDLLLGIEPLNSCLPLKGINPLVLRNRDEVLSRTEACRQLGLVKSRSSYLLYYNGHPEDFIRVKNLYSYLEDEGHQIYYSTNYAGGIFPVVDYFNAFDFLICGTGYNSCWEARFFEKKAIFVPTKTVFESQPRRLAECDSFSFSENGADQLADTIVQLK